MGRAASREEPGLLGAARKASMAASTSATPLSSVATVFTIAGTSLPDRHRDASSASPIRRSAPSRSALFTTKTSAISMMPALRAWTSSPSPGTSTTRPRRRAAISTSSWPTPTVSTRTTSLPGRVSTVSRRRWRGQAAQVAARRHRADEDARVGRVRLHADAVAQDRAARVRAGGIYRDRRRPSPWARRCAVSRSTRVDLPAPGGPVMPTKARPACGNSAAQERAARRRARPRSA